MDLESVKCPINEGHQRSGRRLNDLTVTLPAGEVEDFVWTWYSECLIQDDVLHFLRNQKFAGFDVKSVKARFKSRTQSRPPKLWELIVTGWAGMAPPESGVHLVEHCPACNHRVYSGYSDPEKLIKESQWDGSDFFIVWPLPRFIFVSDRLAQAIGNAKLKGTRIIALEQLGPCDGLTPGRLSYYMPDERARLLGEPLGIY
jgi:hypothetical protein